MRNCFINVLFFFVIISGNFFPVTAFARTPDFYQRHLRNSRSQTASASAKARKAMGKLGARLSGKKTTTKRPPPAIATRISSNDIVALLKMKPGKESLTIALILKESFPEQSLLLDEFIARSYWAIGDNNSARTKSIELLKSLESQNLRKELFLDALERKDYEMALHHIEGAGLSPAQKFLKIFQIKYGILIWPLFFFMLLPIIYFLRKKQSNPTAQSDTQTASSLQNCSADKDFKPPTPSSLLSSEAIANLPVQEKVEVGFQQASEIFHQSETENEPAINLFDSEFRYCFSEIEGFSFCLGTESTETEQTSDIEFKKQEPDENAIDKTQVIESFVEVEIEPSSHDVTEEEVVIYHELQEEADLNISVSAVFMTAHKENTDSIADLIIEEINLTQETNAASDIPLQYQACESSHEANESAVSNSASYAPNTGFNNDDNLKLFFVGLQLRISETSIRIIGVTSADENANRALVALQIAECFANDDYKTLIIDADFTYPRLYSLLEMPDTPGFANLIETESHFSSLFRPTSINQLHFLACGEPCENVKEMTIQAWELLLDYSRKNYELIIIVLPPDSHLHNQMPIIERIGIIELGKENDNKSPSDSALSWFDQNQTNLQILGVLTPENQN